MTAFKRLKVDKEKQANTISAEYNRDVTRKKRWSFEYQWKEFNTEYLTYGLSSKDEFYNFLNDLRIDASDLKDKTVLDAGCGRGRLTINIANYAKMAVGVDIITLQKQKDTIFINCNIENLPFKDNCFDLVYCEGVLHHTPDPKKAFRELARVNKGKLFLMVYNKRSLFMKLRKYMFTYKYPFCMIKVFSYVLAFLFLNSIMRQLFFKINRKKTVSLQSLAFSIFDCLSPKYQSIHSFEEVGRWFEEAGYKEIVRIVPERCRVLGIK